MNVYAYMREALEKMGAFTGHTPLPPAAPNVNPFSIPKAGKVPSMNAYNRGAQPAQQQIASEIGTARTIAPNSAAYQQGVAHTIPAPAKAGVQAAPRKMPKPGKIPKPSKIPSFGKILSKIR